MRHISPDLTLGLSFTPLVTNIFHRSSHFPEDLREMAETAGLVLGAVALVSLFNTCADCFKLIQIGIQASPDYQKTVIELSVLQLRFARWGEAINVSELHLPEAEQRTLEGLLTQIKHVFADSEDISRRYQQKANEDELPVYDAVNDMEPMQRNLFMKLRDMAKTPKPKDRESKPRTPKAPIGMRLTRKIAWALYRKQDLDGLIADICRLIDHLETTFPVQEMRRRLCEQQRDALEEENLPLNFLRDAIKQRNLDPLFESLVTQPLNRNNIYQENVLQDGGRMQNGSMYIIGQITVTMDNRYIGNKAIGKGSSLLNGDSFGGKSDFWND